MDYLTQKSIAKQYGTVCSMQILSSGTGDDERECTRLQSDPRSIYSDGATSGTARAHQCVFPVTALSSCHRGSRGRRSETLGVPRLRDSSSCIQHLTFTFRRLPKSPRACRRISAE